MVPWKFPTPSTSVSKSSVRHDSAPATESKYRSSGPVYTTGSCPTQAALWNGWEASKKSAPSSMLIFGWSAIRSSQAV